MKYRDRGKDPNNIPISRNEIERRRLVAENGGWPLAKWLQFSERMLDEGFHVTVKEAKSTVSKYVCVSRPNVAGKAWRVRFSNHKPLERREIAGDCDFFVGVTNLSVTNTEQAIAATLRHFESLALEEKNGA